MPAGCVPHCFSPAPGGLVFGICTPLTPGAWVRLRSISLWRQASISMRAWYPTHPGEGRDRSAWFSCRRRSQVPHRLHGTVRGDHHHKRRARPGWRYSAMASSEHGHRTHDGCYRPRCDFHSAAMDTGGRSNNTDHGLALVLRQTSVRVVGVARTLAGPTHST
jgi:hypothetical protein